MDNHYLYLYAKLSEHDGISTYFRKFDSGTLIVQYKGNQLIGQVRVDAKHMEIIQQSPFIKTGDGKTPQSLPPGDALEGIQTGRTH
jgi:hypothetical protein